MPFHELKIHLRNLSAPLLCAGIDVLLQLFADRDAALQIESEGTVAGNAEILRRVMLHMYAQRGKR